MEDKKQVVPEQFSGSMGPGPEQFIVRVVLMPMSTTDPVRDFVLLPEVFLPKDAVFEYKAPASSASESFVQLSEHLYVMERSKHEVSTDLSVGTAFLCDGYLLTAKHVVDRTDRSVFVMVPGCRSRRMVKAQVELHPDPKVDVARLRVDHQWFWESLSNPTGLILSANIVPSNQSVQCWGLPSSTHQLQCHFGSLLGSDCLLGTIYKGMSGGPVIESSTGMVIGITSAIGVVQCLEETKKYNLPQALFEPVTIWQTWFRTVRKTTETISLQSTML